MNNNKLCTITDCFGILICIVVAVLIAVSCAGCGHNTGTFLMGTMAKVGLDSQNAIPTITYVDGFQATDISRENSGWVVEIDATSGITTDKQGNVKGIRSIKRYIGPQITGNLVDLSKTNPELAASYVKAVENFWAFQNKLLEQKDGKKDSAN